MAARAGPVAETGSGALRGVWNGPVAEFRGVRYAAPPVDALRFAPPHTAAPWSGLADAVEDGPIPPQLPSRLTPLLGSFARPHSEDCLSLTIWTPAPDAGRRPVLVALHGGAWVSGAGSLAWYDGHRLAREGDVVVVGVNSRLGALGYLHLPGVSDGNLGLLDQEAALGWVRDNIAAFGGDPREITLMGQSAGGFAIIMMLARPGARRLFKRAIVQSSAFRKDLHRADEAAASGRRFAETLGCDPKSPDLANRMRALPVERLLEAQVALGRAMARPGNLVGPFRPVQDFAGTAAFYAAVAEGAAGREVLVGTNREETAAFFSIDPQLPALEAAAVAAIVASETGDPVAWERYRRLHPGATPVELLCDAATDYTFRLGSLQFAARVASDGGRAYVYQFDWAPAGSPAKACHCIELPFVFGTFAAWRDAPMLKGADRRTMEALSAPIRRSWLVFARGGDPNHDEVPAWPAYDADRRMTMRFDSTIGAVGDLAGYRWRSAPPLFPG